MSLVVVTTGGGWWFCKYTVLYNLVFGVDKIKAGALAHKKINDQRVNPGSKVDPLNCSW